MLLSIGGVHDTAVHRLLEALYGRVGYHSLKKRVAQTIEAKNKRVSYAVSLNFGSLTVKGLLEEGMHPEVSTDSQRPERAKGARLEESW